MAPIKIRTQPDAYERGYWDRENQLPRNCPWFDRERQAGYRNGYNAAKRAEMAAS